MDKKEFSIEKAFDEIDEIIRKLEDPALSLGESMDIYKKGVLLLGDCNEALDRTRKEMITIQEEYRHAILEPESE